MKSGSLIRVKLLWMLLGSSETERRLARYSTRGATNGLRPNRPLTPLTETLLNLSIGATEVNQEIKIVICQLHACLQETIFFPGHK